MEVVQRDGQAPAPTFSKTFERAKSRADRAITATQENAEHLSSILSQTARALEKSAALADEHAVRRGAAGRTRDAADERRAAQRARQAGERARSHAARFLELAGPR